MLCELEHGFCKVETDPVPKRLPQCDSLVEATVRITCSPERLKRAVAEISSEGGVSVENRTSAIRTLLMMGAAGRDFHNFNVVFRNNPRYRVAAFTTAKFQTLRDDCTPASVGFTVSARIFALNPARMSP